MHREIPFSALGDTFYWLVFWLLHYHQHSATQWCNLTFTKGLCCGVYEDEDEDEDEGLEEVIIKQKIRLNCWSVRAAKAKIYSGNLIGGSAIKARKCPDF